MQDWQVQQCVKDKPNLIPVESVLPPWHPLQFQSHGFGHKHLLARFDQIAGQHIGVQADHGCINVAGSKSLGTGGMVVFSRPKPLAVGLLAGRAGLTSR